MAKIPSHAKKVFSGVLFDVYQWEQEMFDGTHQTFEMVRGYDVAKAILIHDGKIWLTHEHQPNHSKIDMPGGMLHRDEDPSVGIQREVNEETGMIFQQYSLLCTLPQLSLGAVESYRHFFVCKDLASHGDQTVDIGGEHIDITPYKFEDFVQLILDEKMSKKDFSYWFLKEYYIPGKLEEFRNLLFS